MEKMYDLDTFAKILTEKGYDGYFFTQDISTGKLRECLGKYLDNFRNGMEGLPKDQLLLVGYLEWNGEERPSVHCSMLLAHHEGTFDIQKMEIIKKDRYAASIKEIQLNNLSAHLMPKATEAIALAHGEPKQKALRPGKRFRP